MECIAYWQSGRAGRVKRLVLLSVVVALLLAPLLPAASLASTQDVLVTATVFLNPLEVIASAPSPVAANTVFTVQAIVRNHGSPHIEKAVAVIHLPKNVELVRSKAEVKLGSIPARRYATANWEVKALKKGNYVILVSASGVYSGVAVTGEDAVLVSVSR